MEFAVAFIGLPIASYLVLASLRRGRPAMVGILGAAGLSAVLFATQLGAKNGYMTALIMLVFSAIALAAVVQAVRMALGEGRPRWVYPLIVVVAPLVAGIPLRTMLGT